MQEFCKNIDMNSVYQEYASLVYRFLYSYTQDAEWSQKLMQETFLRAVGSILRYNGGVETVNGTEGIRYSVHSVIGENATFWTFNDQLITDGDFEIRDFEIWISLDKPYQILINDYQSGKYTDDYSIISRH